MFWQREGVRLNKDAFKYNAAKRQLAKLCLNPVWGKVGEKCQRAQSKLISEPKELYSFLATPDVQVSNTLFLNEEVVWISATFRRSARSNPGAR